MRVAKLTVVASLVWSGAVLGQPAPQLFRVTHDTFGCANPRATGALTNRADPRQSDPEWVAFVVSDGHCVNITPRSLWRLVFKEGDLAFMTYAGTTAGPGSFYIRLDELSAPVLDQSAGAGSALPKPELQSPTPDVAQVRPNVTATPLPSPAPSSIPSPSVLPEVQSPTQPTPKPKPPAVARTGSPNVVVPPPAPPVSSSPVQVQSPVGQGQPQNSGGGALLAVLVIGALIWLASRGKRRKTKPPAAVRVKTPPPIAPRPASASVSVGSSPAVWIRIDQPVTVAGIGIPGGALYVGGPMVRGSVPPCFIDPSLGVANVGDTSSRLDMPYWPSYSKISPRCRFAYLKWLEGGRCDPAANIGYVFLFLYGLERRLFVDGTDLTETGQLLLEVERLLTVYGSSKSFNGYASGLLEAARLRSNSGNNGRNYTPPPDAPLHRMPVGLKVAIAQRVAAGEPLPFDLALAGLLGLPSGTLPLSGQALERVKPQFMHLMRRRFEESCPLGYKLLDESGPRLDLMHRCATAGLTIDMLPSLKWQRLPDPAALAWNKLVDLAVPVAEQLEAFTKLQKVHPERAKTLAALSVLPRGFDVEAVGPAASRAKRWLEELPKPISRVAFSELAEHSLGARATQWTGNQHRAVSEALAAASYGLEPQHLAGSSSVKGNTMMFVFPDADAAGERTPSYPAALAGAELAEAVSRIDPASAEAVRTGWLAEVRGRLPLSHSELFRLDARMRWLQQTGPTTTAMRQRLRAVPTSERATVARLAADAAAAAGFVAKGQLALLENVYDEFGLDRSELYSTMHAADARRMGSAVVPESHAAPPDRQGAQHAAEAVSQEANIIVPLLSLSVSSGTTAGLLADGGPRLDAKAAGHTSSVTEHPPSTESKTLPKAVPASEPVIVSEAIPEAVHRIPTRPAVPATPPPAAVSNHLKPVPPPVPKIVAPALNADRIKAIKAETERASRVLAEVFMDDAQVTATPEAKVSSDVVFSGLDKRHAALVTILASRDGWTRAEFEAAVRSGGLLPDGAMETINEWAFDRFDAPLVDDGESFTIDTALLGKASSGTDAH